MAEDGRRRRGGSGGLFPAGYEKAAADPRRGPEPRDTGGAPAVAGSEPGPTARTRRAAGPAEHGDGPALVTGEQRAVVAHPGTVHTGEQEVVAPGGPGYGAGDVGYDAAGYDAAGYDAAGHDAAGYDDARYGDAGYDDAGYDDARYDDAGYDDAAYLAEGRVDPGHAARDDAGFLTDDHVDAGYEDPAYVDAGYVDDGYDDEYDDYDYDDYDGDHPVRHRAALAGRRHPVLFGFMALLLLVVLLAGAGILWASRQINPGGHLGADVTVRIPSDSTTAEIGTDLASAGVIHGGSLFRYYVKIQGSGSLLAGTYVLPRNESYDEAIAALQKGPAIVTDKLVIPEGFTLAEIAQRVAALPGMHLSAAKFLRLSSSGSVRSSLEPSGVNDLEGLVYAATYPVERTETESGILEQMVGDFEQHMDEQGLAAGAAKLHMTPYEVIKVASIVQGEAKDLDQFGDTASVIYNRLSSGMTLGTDSTLVYALRLKNPDLDLSKVTYEESSPYNTRLHKGLPPTPIDNPSLAALSAAINPPHTDLEYFVEINPDGQLGFAATNAGFEQLVNTCKANKLC